MTQSNILVESLSGGATLSLARRFALVAAGVCVITIGAKVQVPFWPVPMTLQTLALMVVFAASGLRLSLEIVLSYLALGLLGLPVFAGAVAGPLYFAGPTAGFLLGFVVAAWIIGTAVDRGWNRNPVKLFSALLTGEAVIFGLGFLWLGFMFTTASGQTLGANAAFENGVKPFLLADFFKLILATIMVSSIVHWVQKRKN